MHEQSDQEKLVEIYMVLSDLRYLMHRESNTLSDFQKISVDYYHRIAASARYAADMLPDEIVSALDEP